MRLIAATALFLAAGQAEAQRGSGDIVCSTIERHPEGGFTYRVQSGLSVLALVRADGPFAWEHGGEVVGFACIRGGRGLPEIDEVEVLQAGFSLAVGGMADGMRSVQLEVREGRIVTETLTGTLAPGDARRLEAIVAAMQARLDAAR